MRGRLNVVLLRVGLVAERRIDPRNLNLIIRIASHQIVACRQGARFVRYAVAGDPWQHSAVSTIQHAYGFGVKTPRLTVVRNK